MNLNNLFENLSSYDIKWEADKILGKHWWIARLYKDNTISAPHAYPSDLGQLTHSIYSLGRSILYDNTKVTYDDLISVTPIIKDVMVLCVDSKNLPPEYPIINPIKSVGLHDEDEFGTKFGDDILIITKNGLLIVDHYGNVDGKVTWWPKEIIDELMQRRNKILDKAINGLSRFFTHNESKIPRFNRILFSLDLPKEINRNTDKALGLHDEDEFDDLIGEQASTYEFKDGTKVYIEWFYDYQLDNVVIKRGNTIQSFKYYQFKEAYPQYHNAIFKVHHVKPRHHDQKDFIMRSYNEKERDEYLSIMNRYSS